MMRGWLLRPPQMSLSVKETIADIVCRVVARQRGWSEAIRGRRLSLRLKSMRREIAEHRAIDRPAPPVQSRVIVCSHAWSTRQSGFGAPDGGREWTNYLLLRPATGGRGVYCTRPSSSSLYRAPAHAKCARNGGLAPPPLPIVP